MGRSGQKPRKGKHHHLPKVGTATELAGDGARERGAVMDTMGLGGLSPAVRSVLFWLMAFIVIGGVAALVIALIAD